MTEPDFLSTTRASYDDLRFYEGSMTTLHLPDTGQRDHLRRQVDPEHAEFHRVLAPGGHLLLVFQVVDERFTGLKRSVTRSRSTTTGSSRTVSPSC
ncbi:hypothetical protein [Streptomyces sp. NBC_01794]|uniref:hypothetical protein n=1 Tax=Streptomyces sp. NBC_01794 TaxID=2975942 RepID=UPI0030931227|nr:hypothetical protein OIE54_22090 [Streptomyces sp. NBC_01794]